MSEGKRKEYWIGDLAVVWQAEKCIHSEECRNGLPEVFDPEKRPWVNVKGAAVERIIAQVAKCPSGALSILRRGDAPRAATGVSAQVMPDGPLVVTGMLEITLRDGTVVTKEGKTAFCRCGASKNKPYCDGTHAKIGFRDA